MLDKEKEQAQNLKRIVDTIFGATKAEAQHERAEPASKGRNSCCANAKGLTAGVRMTIPPAIMQ